MLKISTKIPSPALFAALFVLIIGLYFPWVTLAKGFPNFHAEFSVHFLGFELGTAYQSFQCQQTQCTLTSKAKPEGIVAKFVNEATEETIQIEQTDQQFRWLSYHKVLTRHKSGQTLIKHTQLMRKQNQIVLLQSDTTNAWPASDHLYDTISIAYAIAYRLGNQQALTPLILQDDKGQYPLKLQTQTTESIELPWLDDEVQTHYLKFDSRQATIRLWLLKQPLNNKILPKSFKAFPAAVEVYNKDTRKTVELILQAPPH